MGTVNCDEIGTATPVRDPRSISNRLVFKIMLHATTMVKEEPPIATVIGT